MTNGGSGLAVPPGQQSRGVSPGWEMAAGPRQAATAWREGGERHTSIPLTCSLPMQGGRSSPGQVFAHLHAAGPRHWPARSSGNCAALVTLAGGPLVPMVAAWRTAEPRHWPGQVWWRLRCPGHTCRWLFSFCKVFLFFLNFKIQFLQIKYIFQNIYFY